MNEIIQEGETPVEDPRREDFALLHGSIEFLQQKWGKSSIRELIAILLKDFGEKRRFSYNTVGSIMDDLREEFLSVGQDFHMSRSDFYRQEKNNPDWPIPNPRRAKTKTRTRKYSINEAEAIKMYLRSQYLL